ncbi:MAG: flagellar biosynthetic protein FliR [Eubacterium sp.]|nr:flagellar biosynthetic protein FliR [Eubacterium sp.]
MVDLSFPVQELEYFLLVFVRVATFIFSAPFFSTRNVPKRVRIGLSVFVTYLMYAFYQPHVYPEYNTVLGYGVIVMKEVAVGLLLGAGSQLCTSIVLFAGRIVDMEVGLSMANVFDPNTNQQTSITGTFFQFGVLLILYSTGLHRYLLKALMETFTLIPIAGAKFNLDSLLETMVTFLADYIVIGFRICLPVFASITLMNIILGLLAKLAPQMNMFSVGIQLKLLAGLSVLFLTIGMLPSISNFISNQIQAIMVAVVEGMM